MKSAKAKVNGQSVVMNRIGALSLVTWMVVSLSAGTALAATEYKLRKLDKDGNPGEEVQRLSLTDEKEVIELLTVGERPKSLQEYVGRFSEEPTVFVEGIWKSVAKAKDAKAFEKDIKEGLKGILVDDFRSDKTALLKAIDRLFEIKPELLAKMTREELLKEIFSGMGNEPLRTALELTEKDKAVAKKKEEKGRVGEPALTDADIEKLAQEHCDTVNPILENSRNQIAQIKDAMNEAFNRFKAATKAVQNAMLPKKEQPEDATAALVKEFLDKNKKAEPVAQVAAAPAAPAAAADDEEEAPKSVLDNPLPQPNQQQQMPFMPSQQAAVQREQSPEINPDLPTNTGASNVIAQSNNAVGLADDALALGMPSQVNPLTGQPFHPIAYQGKLGGVKAATDLALVDVNEQLKQTKTKISQLDKVMDRIKNDASNAVPQGVKQRKLDKEANLKAAKDALAAKEKELQPMTQFAMMNGGGDPNTFMALEQQKRMYSQAELAAVAQAQAEFDDVVKQEKAIIAKATPMIASYESDKNSLEMLQGELQTRKNKLTAQQSSVESALAANAASLSGNQGAAAGSVFNRIGGSSPVTPSARNRGIGGALVNDGRRPSLSGGAPTL